MTFQNLQAAIQEHLAKLDADVASNSYHLEVEPAVYETKWWQGHERLMAMFYHQGNVLRILADERPRADPSEPVDDRIAASEVRIEHSRNEERLTFELIAFLAAAKSCLDFLATILGLYWGRPQLDSVNKLLDRLGRRTDPAADLVARNRKGLKHLQEYRNALLHRTSLRVTIKTSTRIRNEVSSFSTLAIVAADPPTMVTYTRRGEGDQEEPTFAESVGEAVATFEDGSQRTMHFEHALLPPVGHVSIKDFLEEKLEFVRHFVAEAVKVADVARFAPFGRVRPVLPSTMHRT